MWQELGKREEFFEWEIIRGFFFWRGDVTYAYQGSVEECGSAPRTHTQPLCFLTPPAFLEYCESLQLSKGNLMYWLQIAPV